MRTPAGPIAPIARQATPLSANAPDYAGEYAVLPTVRAVIRHIDDGLFIDMPGRGESELFQEATDRFFLKVVVAVVTIPTVVLDVVVERPGLELARVPPPRDRGLAIDPIEIDPVGENLLDQNIERDTEPQRRAS